MLGIAIAATATAVVTVPAAGLLGYRQLRRAAHAERLRITSPYGIEESGFVRIGGIGGIDQWISIRGEDHRNPVILELHGGPGATNLIFAARTRAWERHFTIVRWDMRGAGKTFGHEGGHARREAEGVMEQACRTSRTPRRIGIQWGELGAVRR
jgi:pimeloyl-ACP methyl ester carboxylesterase